MPLKKKKKFDYIDVIANVFMVLFSITILYPMLHVVAVSLSDSLYIMQNSVTIFPKGFTLESYEYFLERSEILTGFLNGVWYTVEGVAANLIFTALMAYPLSKMKLIGRSFIMKLCVFTMYFSGGLIPIFIQINEMGLMNTEWAWILGDLIGTTNLIILINGYQAIPDSLYEAAYLDGASEFQVFYKIALPLTKASLASIGLFYFIAHWNNWFSPMLYLQDKEKFPLQLIMREILIENTEQGHGSQLTEQELTPVGIKNALIVMSMIPVMIVYPFVQRYFVKGVMIGSVKG